MKKTRAISLLLSLSLVCAILLPATAVCAEGADSGMVIRKTAEANGNGTYTIQLEVYATGSKVITEVTEDIPTDIVLVLDQSGSMKDPIGTVTFSPYTNNTTNSDYYARRANGDNPNLYYSLGNDSYASVSMTLQQSATYTEITYGRNNPDSQFYTSYWSNRNNLYAKVNGEYLKVTVSRTSRNGTYTYALPDGTVIGEADGRNGNPSFSKIDDEYLYLASIDESKNVYTYIYTDVDGNIQTIGTSIGASTTFGTTLYQRVVNTSAGGSRLNALKTAVTTFANSVAKKAAGPDGDITTAADNVNHRIAIVGYAYGSQGYGGDPAYTNTEVFIGNSQYIYGASAQGVYGSAFQNMNTQTGQNNVAASIAALDANGATYTNLGMEMANGIFNANPVPDGEQRNRVIVVFTDGQPGWSGYDSTVANAAISQSAAAKGKGVTVYTVGVFSGANAGSAGDANGDDIEKANWFMQNLSGNNGTPQDPSYYLSAADAKTLNNIFQQISDQIESGGSSTTLSSETVIRDIIAPAFTLPAGTTADNITLETYHCTGKNGDAYTWSENSDAMGAVAAVNGDQVSVTGFDFAEHYVGTVTEGENTSYRGDKLVISFTVTPKAGFLGGNNVYTNTSAGVYADGAATEPVLTFDRPQVNVPINNVAMIAQEKNVYLLGNLTPAQLKDGAAVKVGDVQLDLSKADDTDKPYGLEPWQTEYVNITIEIRDQSGNVIFGSLTDLDNDQRYTVSATVSPKEEAKATSSGDAAAEKHNSVSANINVYKPELTFKDSAVYYGADVPTDFSGNKTSEIWKHNGTASTDDDVVMIGDKPALNITCTPENDKITDNKINTKQDFSVDVAVKIGTTDVTEKTAFIHTKCAGDSSCTDPANGRFWLHVNTCRLTIEKTGGAGGEPYVFTIYKNGERYSEVTVLGNASETIYELPVGTYTVEEDTGWSWRYTPAYGDAVELSENNHSGTVTCTNEERNHYWLNGVSAVVKNIFGVGQN